MQINIPNISISPDKLIKHCGYAEIRNREGQTSYVRRLRGYQYPRFHVYLEKGYINLHLDQKKPSYQGVSAHSGEYDTEVVKEEGKRIKEVINEYKK